MGSPQVNAQRLKNTAAALLAGDNGLLAIDESISTCNKRFAELGIPQTAEARRGYRELIAKTPGLAESISGVILFDETIRDALGAHARDELGISQSPSDSGGIRVGR